MRVPGVEAKHAGVDTGDFDDSLCYAGLRAGKDTYQEHRDTHLTTYVHGELRVRSYVSQNVRIPV